MNIDRIKVKQAFLKYVSVYDSTDEKIRLKIDHTMRVADLCKEIAISEGFTDGDAQLAWLCGMLHDIGRFEQIRRFGTFVDADSIDHAMFGADLLFHDGVIEQFSLDEALPFDLIEHAVRYHSMYRLPEEITLQERSFCDILRDADKIDILRVNVDVPLEQIYNTSTEKLRRSEVSGEVMDSFREHHATLRSLKKTPVDFIVGHISLVFELVYPRSRTIVREQGYLEQLLYFSSDNERTLKQFEAIRHEIDRMFL